MKDNQSGAATAELVIVLPIIITLSLLGVNLLSEVIQKERLRFIAEGVVQAVMREESEIHIAREVRRSLPGAHFSVTKNEADGTFRVTVSYQSASASAIGFQ